jgi:GNAT superfamily N-acetyltransferase
VFLAFPYRIYRGDPSWIPRLWPEQMSWLRRTHNFFEVGDADWFVARQNGQVLGTIGAAIDHRYNHHFQRRWGVFGFFEFAEDESVFAALVDCARGWLRTRGMTHMLGPQSFAPNDYPGFLVGRHDTPAALYAGHSPSYYLEFAQRAGWAKYQDSIAYRLVRGDGNKWSDHIPEWLTRIAQRVQRNPTYGVRRAELEHFEREFQHVLRLYNRSLSRVPGFAPVTEGEFRKYVQELLPVLDPEMVLFALVDGKEVGFALAIPNLAEAFQKSGGLRHPWDYGRLWWTTKHIKSVSFKILAMDPDFWGRGIEVLMYLRLAELADRRGYEWADLSLTGDDNPQTNKIAAHAGLEEYKRYRTFLVPV